MLHEVRLAYAAYPLDIAAFFFIISSVLRFLNQSLYLHRRVFTELVLLSSKCLFAGRFSHFCFFRSIQLRPFSIIITVRSATSLLKSRRTKILSSESLNAHDSSAPKLEMIDLTVGQAAAVINVAVVVGRSTLFRRTIMPDDELSIAQLSLPLAVVYVLAGVLEESNNAITWYDASIFHL